MSQTQEKMLKSFTFFTRLHAVVFICLGLEFNYRFLFVLRVLARVHVINTQIGMFVSQSGETSFKCRDT